MGIFDFFKKITKTEPTEEIVKEKLAFSEIENWLEKKKRENEVKEEQILILVKDKIKNFNDGLRIKIILLNEFDIKSKKVEDKIKEIVNDSRVQYIGAVENLMNNLENFKETKFSDFTKKINKIFFNFNKASFKNYERTTILIGKEMAKIKEDFKTFSKDLLKIFNNNKEIEELFQKLYFIKSKLNSLDPIDVSRTGIREEIKSINEKINQKEKENQRLLDEIEKIKQSQNYKEILELKEKQALLKEELKKDIFALKQLLDFKALANFFHINEEQMNLLKEHKEDFQTNFQKDNGKMIIALLDEAKLNKNTILEKVNLINTKTEETSNYEQEIKKDKTKELYSKIKELFIEINALKIEKNKEEKRDERLRVNKEELINLLKKEFGKMNVEVV